MGNFLKINAGVPAKLAGSTARGCLRISLASVRGACAAVVAASELPRSYSHDGIGCVVHLFHCCILISLLHSNCFSRYWDRWQHAEANNLVYLCSSQCANEIEYARECTRTRIMATNLARMREL